MASLICGICFGVCLANLIFALIINRSITNVIVQLMCTTVSLLALLHSIKG